LLVRLGVTSWELDM